MNISFFDGVNDGKFYSINAGKYDELGEEDIDISEGVNEEIEDKDADTCLNRFSALEKDVSKIHMNLNNLRNEFKGSCKDWNDLSDTVDHMFNNIAELKTIMDKADDRLNKRLNVISEANVVLTDKLNLVEKKLEVFKCIDILDRVTKLEEKVEKLDIDVTSNMGKLIDRIRVTETNLIAQGFNNKPYDGHIMDDIIDRIKKLEKLRPLDCIDIFDRVSKLESKLAVTAQIVEAVEDKVCTVDTINSTISGYDYAIISDRINELEKKVNEELDWKDLTGSTVFESIKNGILNSIKGLEMENPTPIYYDNELKYFTTPGCAKGEIHDSVNHPSHYTDGKYECIDFIEEYGTITHIGNAIKYASRAGKKDEDAYVEDLKKGLWYLHRYNCPPKKKHIDVIDYCKDKKLPDELTNVLIAISRENYVEAERVLRKYIEELKK